MIHCVSRLLVVPFDLLPIFLGRTIHKSPNAYFPKMSAVRAGVYTYR